MLLAWIIPHERAALTFTEAEVAFLFPAPVTRRTLIHFKLLRSQLGIFFSVLLLTLFSRRFGGNAWIHALGWWLILSTLNLHFLGSSFARTMLLDRGISNWLRRLLVFGLAVAMAAAVWIWAKRTLPELGPADTANLNAILDYAQRVLTAGPALYLLYPFRLVVRPFLAQDATAFFVRWPRRCCSFCSITCGSFIPTWPSRRPRWKLRKNWPCASPPCAPATGRARRKIKRPNVRGSSWPPPARPPRRCSGKISSASARFFPCASGFFSSSSWWPLALAWEAPPQPGTFPSSRHSSIAIALGYSLLLGPQLLRLDFRNDLPLADILKTFPMRGWQIALGEILAPVAVLAACQWLLLLVGAGLIFYLPGKQEALFLAIALGAAVLLPVLDLLLLLIPNAAVLLFPSWIQTGKDSPRGIEATGQRLIFALGQMLVLLVALLPAAAAFVGVFFLLYFAFGPAAAVPLASLAATVILAVEAGFGVMLLGKLFERFDVTEEHTS